MRSKGLPIDVAETGNVLDANGRKVVGLCGTNKGMVLELLKFCDENGGSFPRWCSAKEELPSDATAAAQFQQFFRKAGSYSGDDACDALR